MPDSTTPETLRLLALSDLRQRIQAAFLHKSLNKTQRNQLLERCRQLEQQIWQEERGSAPAPWKEAIEPDRDRILQQLQQEGLLDEPAVAFLREPRRVSPPPLPDSQRPAEPVAQPADLPTAEEPATVVPPVADLPTPEQELPLPSPVSPEPEKERWLEVLTGLVERTRGLVLLGIVVLILSIFPAFSYLTSATGIYLVLLVYTLGIFLGSRFIRPYFPWTGNALAVVTLCILPGDFMFISGLDLRLEADQVVSLLAIGLLSFLGNGTLRDLAGEVSGGYRLSLLGLGLIAAFTRSLNSAWIEARYPPELFELGFVLAGFALLMLGSIRQVASARGVEGVKPAILLQGFALYAYVIPVNLIALPAERLGLLMFVAGIPLLVSAMTLGRRVPWPSLAEGQGRELSAWLSGLDLGGLTLSLAGGALAIGNVETSLAVCVMGVALHSLLAYRYRHRVVRWAFVSAATLFLAGLVFWGLAFLQTDLDWRSLVTSLIALALAEEARHAPARWPQERRQFWQEALTWAGVSLTAAAWAEFGAYALWSYAAFAALLPIAVVYLYFSLHQQRNVFSYVGVVTLAIALLGLLTVLNPELALESYRYSSIALAFVFLGIGYLVQVGSLRAAGTATPAPPPKRSPATWREWLGTDIIRPFRLQERFATPVPYLVAEPFYSVGLVVVTAAALTGWRDLLVPGSSAVYYALLFFIYPSQLLLYFAATALTGEGLHLALLTLPERYQNLGLFLISISWLAIGTVLEELVGSEVTPSEGPSSDVRALAVGEVTSRTARDSRDRPTSVEYARPFYHLGLVVNLFLLRSFFQNWQELFTPEGWARAQQDTLLLLLTSAFYALNLRVYVSKLWLYPLIILASMALYFGGVGRLDPLWYLPGITFIAFFWLGAGTAFNRSARIWELLRGFVNRRMPAIDAGSRYYRYHLQDFASPFYASAFYLAGFSLIAAAGLLAGRLSQPVLEFWQAVIPIAEGPAFMAVQAINLTALAVFYTVYYPRRVPTLIGEPEERPYPQEMRYLPIISITLAAFWLADGLFQAPNLALVSVTTAWGWGAYVGLRRTSDVGSRTGDQQAPSMQSLAPELRPYYFFSLGAAATAIVLPLLPMMAAFSDKLAGLNLPEQRGSALAALLTAAFLVYADRRLQPDYFHRFLALLVAAWGMFLVPRMLPLLWQIGPPLGVLLVAWLGLALVWREREKEEETMAIPAVIVAVAAVILTVWKAIGWESAPVSALQDACWFFHTFLLGAFFVTIGMIVKETEGIGFGAFLLLFPFTGLAYRAWWGVPIAFLAALGCHLAGRAVSGKIKELMGSPLAFLAVALPLVVLPLGQPAPSPYGYLPWILLGGGYFTLVAAHSGRAVYWWLAAVLGNVSLGDIWVRHDVYEPNAWLIPMGLSFILLARSMKPVNRDQVTYLGQFLIYLAPITGALISSPYSNLTSLRPAVYLAELGLLVPLAIGAAFLLKRKPFLKFGLLILGILLAGAVVYLFLQPNWLLRWVLMLGLGVGTIALGTYLEVRREEVRAFMGRIGQLLATWE